MNIDNVKAKFKCDSKDGTSLRMSPVTSDSIENKMWSMYTPSGQLQMNVTNQDALYFFEVGEEYFLTFDRV